MATTDSERQALELLFESLVRYSPDGEGSGQYHPGLALGRPQMVPGGRRFQVPGKALWPNDQRLTAGDVRATVMRIKDQEAKGCGLSPAWGELLDKVEVGVGGEALRLELTLRQGCLEPLAPMAFKVLPSEFVLQGQPGLDSLEFGENPVCSGPFKVGKQGEIQGRTSFKLLSNGNFSKRDGARGRVPPIREVHFVQYQNTLADLQAWPGLPIHVALDLTADEVAAILKAQQDEEQQDAKPLRNLKVYKPSDLPPNRRVYFLQPGSDSPLNSADLRRALALAVNREGLLDTHFRSKNLKWRIHKAINGPYPAGSWACAPDLKDNGDLYNPVAARTAYAAYKKNGGKEVTLKLKYPDGDPILKKAMEALCKGVNEVLEVQLLDPEAIDPDKLRKEIAAGTCPLAYTLYDYPDESYWLGPVLDHKWLTSGRAPKVVDLMRQASGRRNFNEVRDHSRQLHRVFVKEEMPLIPLWQLDPLMAVRSTVKAPTFDPRRIFTDVERWTVATPSP